MLNKYLKEGVEFVYKELEEIPEYNTEDKITRLVTKEKKERW